MAMIATIAIPTYYGAWAGINLFCSTRKIIQKINFFRKIPQGDFQEFITGKLTVKIESRSTLKMCTYAVVAGMQVLRISQQQNRLKDALARIRHDWTYYHFAVARNSDLYSAPSNIYLQFRRINLLAKNTFSCFKEGFTLFNAMSDLWEFSVGTDLQRDQVTYAFLFKEAVNIMSQIDQVQFNKMAIQQQLNRLIEIGRKIKKAPSPTVGSFSHGLESLMPKHEGEISSSAKGYVPLPRGEKFIPENPAIEMKASSQKKMGYDGINREALFILD